MNIIRNALVLHARVLPVRNWRFLYGHILAYGNIKFPRQSTRALSAGALARAAAETRCSVFAAGLTPSFPLIFKSAAWDCTRFRLIFINESECLLRATKQAPQNFGLASEGRTVQSAFLIDLLNRWEKRVRDHFIIIFLIKKGLCFYSVW